MPTQKPLIKPKGRWSSKYERERLAYEDSLKSYLGAAPKKGDTTYCAICKNPYIEWREEAFSDIESFKICESCSNNRWGGITHRIKVYRRTNEVSDEEQEQEC